MRSRNLVTALAVACIGAVPAHAQQGVAQPSVTYIDSKSPFFVPAASNADAGGVRMPELAGAASPADAANYDKYFYFHRPDTNFAAAYTDIVECDGYARGLASGVAPSFGQGILGDMFADAISDALYGSANRRKLRRTNMRACMNFKGYDRYGLSKTIWETFNFEEGNKKIDEDVRTGFLKQQALAASSATPQGKALGL